MLLCLHQFAVYFRFITFSLSPHFTAIIARGPRGNYREIQTVGLQTFGRCTELLLFSCSIAMDQTEHTLSEAPAN